jgi:hypothetical protein
MSSDNVYALGISRDHLLWNSKIAYESEQINCLNPALIRKLL